MYLLDTSVVSELRRRRPHPAVLRWLTDVPNQETFVSAVTVGEIQAGIERTREQDSEKASELEAWLAHLVETHEILPMDADAFRAWGRIRHRRSDTLLVDAMIAATARTRGLTVATRNLSDFLALGVDAFDPFSGTWSRVSRS